MRLCLKALSTKLKNDDSYHMRTKRLTLKCFRCGFFLLETIVLVPNA